MSNEKPRDVTTIDNHHDMEHHNVGVEHNNHNENHNVGTGHALSLQPTVPALRFTEFVDSGVWEEKKVGEITTSFSGGTPTSTKKEYYNGNIPFVRSAEIDKLQTELFLTEDGLKNSSAKMVEKGDVLLALYGANSGDVAISKISGAINQAVLCLRSRYIHSFLYQFLLVRKEWIVQTFIQGGQGNLSGEIIKSITLSFPSIPEQQKIADCLSSLDEQIASESEQLDALQQHKKGLMQQLFPNVGVGNNSQSHNVGVEHALSLQPSNIPALRFPEFVDSGVWEDDELGKIALISSGGTPKRSEPHYWNGCIPWVTTSLIDFNRITKADEFISSDGLANSSAKLFEPNTVLMAMYGQGKTRGKVALLKIQATTNQACAAIDFSQLIIPQFAFYDLSRRYLEIRKISNEGGQKNLSGTIIKKIKLSYPTLSEQQKIANCLSSLDDLITAQREKIDALKLHKKGLMQGLFPNVGVV
ncbi:MAG: restriction endonuclease subunit S [Gammaproteobacteria bacterium]|nr:restriction endonuclease subunit S [Gammaproteobacteria bacterium]